MIDNRLKKIPYNQTIKKFWKMATGKDKDTLNFDIYFQRNKVWDNSRKSLLIDSILRGYPIPPAYAVRKENTYFMLDGKQRFLSAIVDFINGEYELIDLESITLNGEVYILNGKKFDDLDEELKDEILSETLTIYYFEDITDDQIEEIFERLNNGMPLSKFEITRCKAGQIMDCVKEITKHSLFTKMNFTEKQVLRYQNEETVMQIINVLYAEQPDFTGANIQKFAESFEITEEQKEHITAIAEYLNNTLDTIDQKTYKKFMKKVHISILFKVTAQAMQNKVNPEKFTAWLIKFFTEENKPQGTAYNNAARIGSAKKENIKVRITEMTKSYQRTFEVMEEVKADTNKTEIDIIIEKLEEEEQHEAMGM